MMLISVITAKKYLIILIKGEREEKCRERERENFE